MKEQKTPRDGSITYVMVRINPDKLTDEQKNKLDHWYGYSDEDYYLDFPEEFKGNSNIEEQDLLLTKEERHSPPDQWDWVKTLPKEDIIIVENRLEKPNWKSYEDEEMVINMKNELKALAFDLGVSKKDFSKFISINYTVADYYNCEEKSFPKRWNMVSDNWGPHFFPEYNDNYVLSKVTLMTPSY